MNPIWWIVFFEAALLVLVLILLALSIVSAKKFRIDSEKLHRYNSGQTVGATPHRRKLGA